jgi:hypothetical protein
MKRTFFIRRLVFSLLSVGILLGSQVVEAQFTLDGSRDAAYGAPLAVQTVETGFGDNDSELNAAYGAILGGNLHLLLTGQIENNFNKLNIFIDSVAGGENVLTNDANNGGNNPENDDWAGKYAGFTFDGAFAADYLFIARNGNFGGDQFNLDFATIGGGLGAFESSSDIFGGSLTGANASVGASGIGVGYDNTNVGGILGGDLAADPVAAAAVTTGVELVIPLAAIGNPGAGDTILITAHINGSNHDFLSNQSLAGYPPPQDNLGGDGAGTFNGTVGQIDLNDDEYAAGNQFFAISIPAASSRAEFMVAKDFTDDNPAGVEVTISCNTGLPLEQSKVITEAGGVEFVVVDFDDGELDCEVTEAVPAGYDAEYFDGTATSSTSCALLDVEFESEFSCQITNSPAPVDVVIHKEWVIEGSDDADGVSQEYRIDLRCDSEIIDGNDIGDLWQFVWFDEGDATFTAQVIPDFPTTTCEVVESVFDSAVEVDNGCGVFEVSVNNGHECTITNTVFFEGIPTLNRYGLALLALLMLGVGFVGVRRLV